MLAALLILAAVIAYIPAMRAGYIWDDDTLLTANPQMQGLDGLAQIWRGEGSRDYTPVTLSTFWLEWQAWGDNPAAYHVVNLLLHSLSALLLWRILARLGIAGAWLGALLFAIHPVNVASAAWIAELKNTLSAALFFGSILYWLMARDENRPRPYYISLALFLLAAWSKGAVVTLPAVLLLCIWWQDRKITRRDLTQLIPYAAIALATAIVTIGFQTRAQHYGLIPDSLDYRIARAGAVIWFYLGALVWPAGLSPMHVPWLPNLHSPLTYLPAFAAIAMLALFYWKRSGWGRPLLFAYSYFLIMLLPVLGFAWMALLQETPAADWWQYLAAPGIFALAGAGVATAAKHWRFAAPLAAVIIALLLVQTWRRAAIYQSMETYCSAVAAEDPYAWTIENNLGIMLRRRGLFTQSEACYHQALQDNPNYVEAHINLGNTLGAAGDPAGQESEYRLAVKMRPGDPEILDELAGLLFSEGRNEEALDIEAQAVKAEPTNIKRLVKLGGMLAGLHRYPEAETYLRDAATLLPDNLSIQVLLCQTLIAQGKREDALKICDAIDELARATGDATVIAATTKLRQECQAAP